MSEDSDENLLQLSSETFAALQEFYREQETRENKLQEILNAQRTNENITFEENWVK